MRFPWLQVDADFIAARSRDLASLLPPVAVPEVGAGATRLVSRHEAMGMMLDLWSWVLGRTAQDSPPTGLVPGINAPRLVAGAADWRGDPGLFVEALVGAGLAEWGQSGVRLRGLDRYGRTWAKNSRRNPETHGRTPEMASTGRKPAENRQNEPLISAGTGALDADRDVEEASASQRTGDAVPDPEQPTASIENGPSGPAIARNEPPETQGSPSFRLEAQRPARKPRGHRADTPAEALFKALQAMREERCAEVGEPFVPELWTFAQQNQKLRAIAADNPEAQKRFEGGWHEYLAHEVNRHKETAWSLAYFLSAGVRAKYETRAAREEAA